MVGMMSLAAGAQESGAGWYNGRWYPYNPYLYNNQYRSGESGAGWYDGVWYDHNPYLYNDGYYRSYNYDSRYYPYNNRYYYRNGRYYDRNGNYYRNGYWYDSLGRRILNDLLNNIRP